MSKTINRLVCLFLIHVSFLAQAQSARYIVVVTTDGLRCQEVFGGADSVLIQLDSKEPDLYKTRYAAPTPTERRRKLMPFFWSVMANEGQIYGNQALGSTVEVTNSSCISYPGYSELLTGFTDDKHIFLNAKKKNPHTNVLEFLSRDMQVSAFSSWDVFPYILNEERAGFSVNAGFEQQCQGAPESLNTQLETCIRPWSENVRPDTLTWAFAKNCLEKEQPEVLFISFGETDEYAHEGKYGHYLDAAHEFDRMLGELWNYLQHNDKYRDQTALLVTTDHGRSNRHWRQHLRLLNGSDAIWMAVAGPQVQPLGEIHKGPEVKQKQMAQTIAGLVGRHFECEHPVAKRLEKIFNQPKTSPALAQPNQPATLNLQSSLK